MTVKKLRYVRVIPGVSILSSLFTAKLTQKDTPLTKTEFTIAARQYVMLPPLKTMMVSLSNASVDVKFRSVPIRSARTRSSSWMQLEIMALFVTPVSKL